MDIEPLRPQLHLAAALHLLSAVALHGTSPTKAAAIVAHLERISESDELDPVLRQTIGHLIREWTAAPAGATPSGGDYAARPGNLFH